jgi:Ni,Fe-hydrogenase III large subunit
VETPRGTARLRLTLENGVVSDLSLDTPSTRHMGLIRAVVEQRELADALVGVASLDLSPWEVVR